MSFFSRDFTLLEKLLILLLCLVLIGLFYYWFIDQPVKRDIASAEAEREALELELTGLNAKIAQLTRMQEELDRLGSLGDTSRMESYNNSKAELKELNDILAKANSYQISFSNVERDGDTVRRNFNLSFTAPSYAVAKQTIIDLERNQYRCLVGNVSYRDNWGKENVYVSYADSWQSRFEEDYEVTMTAACTFFETMYGGTPDTGLSG